MLKVGLVIGILFVIPHLVLYLPGQQYDDLPIWPLFLIIFSGSVLYTWMFTVSGGSALLAGLMHAASNGLTPLSRGIDPVVGWQLQGIVITVIAVVLVVSLGLHRRLNALGTDHDATTDLATVPAAQPPRASTGFSAT